MGLEAKPVYAFIGVPQGWKTAANLSRQKMWENYEGHQPDEDILIKAQNGRWEERTGLPPEESHLTVIIPVHNERKYLSAALGSLMTSDIPADVHLNVVLVTNDCSDESPWIVEDFMRSLGELEDRPMDDEEREQLGDRAINFRTQTVAGNWTFTHIDTDTAGKANAMNIGNQLALAAGHRIAINIDANNFLEADAIATIFGQAHQSIVAEPDGTVLLSGRHIASMRRPKFEKILKVIKQNAQDQRQDPQIRVMGCLMAWDTEFMKQIGNLPDGALEDYGFSVTARLNGKHVQKVDGAHTWGYEPNNLPDRIEQYVRTVRGKLRIISRGPEYAAIVAEDDPQFMKTLQERAKNTYELMLRDPKKAPFLLLKYLMWEYAFIKGGREYIRDPDNPTWKDIGSTK